jgi:hypothetical protein
VDLEGKDGHLVDLTRVFGLGGGKRDESEDQAKDKVKVEEKI